MAKKTKSRKYARREFLQNLAGGGALAGISRSGAATGGQGRGSRRAAAGEAEHAVQFPRSFTGTKLKMIAFPLGGIGTGTISLGGRGQLRDWEIFNRPDKGNNPDYCFAAVWAQAGDQKPVARVLEARLEPPFEITVDGLGANNVPGLPRLASATFTGSYPLAKIDFHDEKLPARISLEAFNPFIPLDVEASELPIAVLRYSVRNTGSVPVKVSIAYTVTNPVGKEGRQAAYRQESALAGLYMDNPFLPASDPLKGSFALCALDAPEGSVTHLRGWKRAQWWDGALTFWDDFSADGALNSGSAAMMPVGSLAVKQTLEPSATASFTFMLAWHFPNRTPARCGWPAPDAPENVLVGNHYTKRFANAWEASQTAARDLPKLQVRTRKFVEVFRASTLHPAVLDAASSTVSTLRTNTCFRTPDGEFHGFEGCNDQAGCCHGSCTHVWNYEQATAFLFPSLARSLRESEFLRNTAADGQMGFRSYLPDGVKIWNKSAADGQMGCIMKLYRDWQLSGDTDWLRRMWPKAKLALEFAWIKNGWDGNRDGVAEGVQHNTYDVEFYGPNPLCGVWYLGALRAGAEMARAAGDDTSAAEYTRLFEQGSRWFDANLFNGEYYIQKVVGRGADEIPAPLLVGMGTANTNSPDYQMGEACLADQLLGQYFAHIAGLGYLLDQDHVHKTLAAIFRYNYRANLSEHESVQRTYALNDEGGVLVATYPSGHRPEIPFPYFGEIWTGLEYQLAAHLAFEGMTEQALRVVETTRRRFDGERRNPWNEAECGHHYARPMAAWAVFLALSGFGYSAVTRDLTLAPRVRSRDFRCFWSAPSGWGSFSLGSSARQERVRVETAEGDLAVRRVAVGARGKIALRTASARVGNEDVRSELRQTAERITVELEREIRITPDHALELVLSA